MSDIPDKAESVFAAGMEIVRDYPDGVDLFTILIRLYDTGYAAGLGTLVESQMTRRPLIDEGGTERPFRPQHADRRVWVVENGLYSDRYIEGVYESMDVVKREFPVEDRPPEASRSYSYLYHPGGWQPCDPKDPDTAWTNGLDWQDYLQASPWTVTS